MKIYRNNGAIGALLDEYEKAIVELIDLLNQVTQDELTEIADPDTSDEDCLSIQTVLRHVLRAGYFYAIEVRNKQGEKLIFPDQKLRDSVIEYQAALVELFDYNEKLFQDYPDINLEDINPENKVVFSNGQTFDFEQIFEHAIVHILRHRRQIERFLIKLRNE